jgi:VWFA-related protein
VSAFKSKAGMNVLSRFFIFLTAVSLFFSLVAITGANEKSQPKAPDENKISVKTELMEVRAVVTDRSGKIVEGLKKEEFELFENDKPEEISFFSVSEVKKSPSAAPAEKQREAKPSLPEPAQTETSGVAEQLRQPPVRTTLLFVDTLHMSFTNLVRVKETMRRFLKERLTDQDMVAVATSGQTLGIGQQLSKNRQLLNNSIERIRLERSPDMTLTPTLAEEVLTGHLEPTRLAIDLMRRETGSCDCTILHITAQSKARQILLETASLRKTALFTLEKLAEQMMTLPGKRMIVIFSDGFDLHNIDAAVQTDELNSLISRANRSGVVIYSIDSKGMKLSKLEQIKMVQNIPLYKRDDYCDYSFRLRRGDQMDKNIDVAWMSELLRDGKTVKQESWKSIAADAEKDSKGWFDLDGELDLRGFEQGIYELRVSVREGNSKKLVQRDVVFGIE